MRSPCVQGGGNLPASFCGRSNGGRQRRIGLIQSADRRSAMAIKDILLTLPSYPEPTPVSVIDTAISLASLLDAHLAAISCEAYVQVPGSFLSFGNVGGLNAGEAQRSLKNARGLLAAFEAAAQKAGLLHETILQRCRTSDVPKRLADYARLRDLTLVPVPEAFDQWSAEAVIFSSGRPTLVVPETPPARPL